MVVITFFFCVIAGTLLWWRHGNKKRQYKQKKITSMLSELRFLTCANFWYNIAICVYFCLKYGRIAWIMNFNFAQPVEWNFGKRWQILSSKLLKQMSNLIDLECLSFSSSRRDRQHISIDPRHQPPVLTPLFPPLPFSEPWTEAR